MTDDEEKEKLNERLGNNVLRLILHNHGDTKQARAEFAAHFERKPASIWPWVSGARKGIPAQQRATFERLVVEGKIDLPSKSKIDDYVRPTPKRDMTARLEKKNDDLLALIWDCVRHPRLGPRALESIMADTNFLVRKRTPALLLRWAYHEGGVPYSYRDQFSHALVRSGIATELLGYDRNDEIAIELFDIKVNTFFAE